MRAKTKANFNILSEKFHGPPYGHMIDRSSGFTAAWDWHKNEFPYDDIEQIMLWYSLTREQAEFLNKVIKEFENG